MKGLNKFHFIITPDELENILYDFYFYKSGFQTAPDKYPYNYIEINNNELYEKYKRFYDKLISGYKFELRNTGNGFITDELLSFLPILLTDKSARNWEGAMMDFFTLYLDKNRRLATYITYLQYPENITGLELNYGDESNNYKKIKERIDKMTNNLKIEIGGKEYRTKIKISKKAKEGIRNTYFMNKNNCIIK